MGLISRANIIGYYICVGYIITWDKVVDDTLTSLHVQMSLKSFCPIHMQLI